MDIVSIACTPARERRNRSEREPPYDITLSNPTGEL